MAKVGTKKKIGRNEPCPCGSGKKYKKCCLGKAENQELDELDDHMQKGYVLLEKNKTIEACTIWLEVWDKLKSRFSPDMKSIEDAERVFSGLQSLYNWCQDLEMELGNAAWDDRSFCIKRMAYCLEFCSFFPDTKGLFLFNMKRAVAESHFGMGNPSKGDVAFQKLIAEFPLNIWGYIGWGDMYLLRMNKQDVPDHKKAEKIYKMALGKGLEDEEDLKERLEELKKGKREKKKEK